MQEEAYNEKIKELRSIRFNERLRFKSASDKMQELISSFKDKGLPDPELPTISFNDMKGLERNLWYNIDDDISMRLWDIKEEGLKFSVILKAGAKFALKRHDSMQYIVVNEGNLLDLNSSKTYIKGDEVIYLAYEPHEHASDTYSEYIIYFHPPSDTQGNKDFNESNDYAVD